MPRDGAGNYSLPNATNPVVNGTLITPTWANGTLADVATALSQSVSKDGQTPMTGNLPMGGFKLTGLGNGSASGDSVPFGQLADAINAANGMGLLSFVYSLNYAAGTAGAELKTKPTIVSSIQVLRGMSKNGNPTLLPTSYYAVSVPDGGGGVPFSLNSADTTSGCLFTGSVAPGPSAPAAPTLGQVVAGALAATTYYVKTFVNTAAGSTLPSAESSLAVLVNNVLTVASPPTQTGATSWGVAVSTATGTETIQANNIAIGTGWTEPTTGLIAGAAVPSVSTAGSILTISAVTNGTVVTGHRLSDINAGAAVNTYVAGQISGTGGTGTYTVTNSGQTIVSSTMVTDNGGTILLGWDGGRWYMTYTAVVNAKQHGAKGDKVADDTWPLQAMINSGRKSWFVPEGAFNFSSLTLAATVGFSFFGVGPASVLVQTGAGIKFPTLASNNFDSHATIHDLGFDGTAGTGNTLDTTYSQTLDLLNLFFSNVPTGFSSLKLDGNPTSSTYAHDVRVKNLRIYHAVSAVGNAGITLGAFHSDCTIDGFIMNGNFTVNYPILALNGAKTTTVSNSHPYNAKINVVLLQGNNSDFGWDAVTFDNALADTFYSTGSSNGRFTNCFFETTHASQRAVVFDNSYNNTMLGSSFQAPSGVATACVTELNGSSGNKIIGGQIDNVANWTNLFNLSGGGSYAKGFQGYATYDSVYSLAGTAQAAQAQNTATNYGANGANTALGNTAWSAPVAGRILSATIFVDITPAAGQTFTFNLQKNGTTIGTGTVSNGSFGTTITLSQIVAANAVNQGDQISIQSVFSATSGSASPRYSVTLVG